MMNLHIVKIVSVVGILIALAIVASMLLPRFQSQAMPSDVDEQNLLTEEQVSSQGKATATITITMTTAPNPLIMKQE